MPQESVSAELDQACSDMNHCESWPVRTVQFSFLMYFFLNLRLTLYRPQTMYCLVLKIKIWLTLLYVFKYLMVIHSLLKIMVVSYLDPFLIIRRFFGNPTLLWSYSCRILEGQL